MKKITNKHFIELLCNNGSVFAGRVWQKNDDIIIKAMDNITVENVEKIEEKAGRRTVKEKHAKYIIFSNGSRMGFDQDGKYECFEHFNKNGIYLIVQRLEWYDDFDKKYYYNYLVYIIPDLCGEPDENEDGETITTASGKTYRTVERMPDGWRTIEGANTAPDGYKWIYNGEPRFRLIDGKYKINHNRKTMLLKV